MALVSYEIRKTSCTQFGFSVRNRTYRHLQCRRQSRADLKRPPTETETALLLILGPCLLAAVAFEHADGAAVLGIQHGQDKSRNVTAMTTRLGAIGGCDWKRLRS